MSVGGREGGGGGGAADNGGGIGSHRRWLCCACIGDVLLYIGIKVAVAGGFLK